MGRGKRNRSASPNGSEETEESVVSGKGVKAAVLFITKTSRKGHHYYYGLDTKSWRCLEVLAHHYGYRSSSGFTVALCLGLWRTLVTVCQTESTQRRVLQLKCRGYNSATAGIHRWGSRFCNLDSPTTSTMKGYSKIISGAVEYVLRLQAGEYSELNDFPEAPVWSDPSSSYCSYDGCEHIPEAPVWSDPSSGYCSYDGCEHIPEAPVWSDSSLPSCWEEEFNHRQQIIARLLPFQSAGLLGEVNSMTFTKPPYWELWELELNILLDAAVCNNQVDVVHILCTKSNDAAVMLPQFIRMALNHRHITMAKLIMAQRARLKLSASRRKSPLSLVHGWEWDSEVTAGCLNRDTPGTASQEEEVMEILKSVEEIVKPS